MTEYAADTDNISTNKVQPEQPRPASLEAAGTFQFASPYESALEQLLDEVPKIDVGTDPHLTMRASWWKRIRTLAERVQKEHDLLKKCYRDANQQHLNDLSQIGRLKAECSDLINKVNALIDKRTTEEEKRLDAEQETAGLRTINKDIIESNDLMRNRILYLSRAIKSLLAPKGLDWDSVVVTTGGIEKERDIPPCQVSIQPDSYSGGICISLDRVK